MFESTHWSVVLAAAETDSPEAQQAMENLCATYWYPLYAFSRRQGLEQEAARDATQEFFAQRVVTKKIFHRMDAGSGKFRSWLLASLRHHLANENAWRQAQKRGGGAAHISLDLETAEGRYRLEPAVGSTPEEFYDRAWALELLTRARDKLRARYESEDKADRFEELGAFLPGAPAGSSRTEVARRLGQNENALDIAIHRLRQEFGELLRAEIRRTVSCPGELQEEIRYLIRVVGG